MFSVELRENVFAVYSGLIAAGYDLFSLAEGDPVLGVIGEILNVPWPESVTGYFAWARRKGSGVNPYWPRAAMLLAVSFYAGVSEGTSVGEGIPACSGVSMRDEGLHASTQIPDRGFFELFRSFPVSPEEKDSEVLEWLVEFPSIWRQMSSAGSLSRLWVEYHMAMDVRIKEFYKTVGDVIDSFVGLTGVSPQSLPRICVIPNPLQAPQVADFVSKDGTVYIIVAEPRASSIVHELVHKVFEPGIQAARDRVMQSCHLLMPVYQQMVSMQYAWDQSPDSWLRVFEENFVRAAAIWVEHSSWGAGLDAHARVRAHVQAHPQARVHAQACAHAQAQAQAQAHAHAHALAHARDGFVYVPAMVRLFFEEWNGVDDIGGFIEKVLQACERMV